MLQEKFTKTKYSSHFSINPPILLRLDWKVEHSIFTVHLKSALNTKLHLILFNANVNPDLYQLEMLDGLSNYSVFELKKTIFFIWSTWSCKQHMPSPPHMGQEGWGPCLSPSNSWFLSAVPCTGNPGAPKPFQSRLHSLSESVGNWHSPFGRTLLLTRQISELKSLGSKGRRCAH